MMTNSSIVIEWGHRKKFAEHNWPNVDLDSDVMIRILNNNELASNRSTHEIYDFIFHSKSYLAIKEM